MINLVMQSMTTVWFDGSRLRASQETGLFPEQGGSGRVIGTHLSGGATLVVDSYQTWDYVTALGTALDDVPKEVLADLRLRYRYPERSMVEDLGVIHPDPAGLMPDGPFTVLQLRKLYEAIYGRPFMKDTFRRRVIAGLEPTGAMADDFGRPAELYVRRGAAA